MGERKNSKAANMMRKAEHPFERQPVRWPASSTPTGRMPKNTLEALIRQARDPGTPVWHHATPPGRRVMIIPESSQRGPVNGRAFRRKQGLPY